MAESKEHFRHIMLFYYRKGKNASQAQKKICSVYGESAVDSSTCRKWFKKFRVNNFNLNDAPRSGRPTAIDANKLLELIDGDQRKTTQEIGAILGINRSTVSRRSRQLGIKKPAGGGGGADKGGAKNKAGSGGGDKGGGKKAQDQKGGGGGGGGGKKGGKK